MAFDRKTKVRLAGVLLTILLLAVFVGLQCSGAFERLEYSSLDARYRMRGPVPLDSSVSVVAIDEDTLRTFGWPLPRATWAALIDLGRKHGAKVIGFDVLFSDPGPAGPEQDTLFAQIAAGHGDVVFPSQMLFHSKDDMGDVNTENAGPSGSDDKTGIYAPKAFGIVPPLAALAEASAGSAHFQLDSRPDGVFRKAPLFVEYKGDLIPALALRLVSIFRGFSLDKPRLDDDGELKIDDKIAPIPLSRQGHGIVYMDFRTVSRGIRSASLLDLLRAQACEEKTCAKDEVIDLDDFFRDKLVLVGQTSGTVGDHGPTPLSNSAPLLLAQANLADNLLRGRLLTRASPLADALVLVLLSIAISWIAWKLRIVFSSLAILLLLGGYYSLSYLALAYWQVWLDSMAPLVAGVFIALLTIGYRYFITDADGRFLRKAFEKYVAPGLINRIMENPEEVNLFGATKRISILFSDIKGYTSLSNSLEPRQVLDILRLYMDVMTKVLFAYGGTVDKIMGDGIMSYFGDPITFDDHAARAIDAAIEMQQKQKDLQEKWRAEGLEGLQIRIGIATGEVYVGNIGSRYHVEYTALGRSVNLASRLESAAPAGGILVSRETYQDTKKSYDFEKVEGLVLKGYENTRTAYLIKGRKS